MKELYDVLAVGIDDSKIRIMAKGKTENNAEAVILIAIARRGLEKEFFTSCEAGKFKEGDTYSHLP